MAKSARTHTRRKTGGPSIGVWIVGISVVIVLLVVAAVAFNSRQSTAAIEPPDVQEEWLNGTVMGNPDAPITVQMWEDFLCPACRQWTAEIEPQLIENYVKSGDVKLDFQQFPLSSHAPGSNMAAMASLCAADQDAFWTYHSRLFPAQDDGQAGFTVDALVQYADELDLDSREFMSCMSSQKYREQVSASVNQAQSMGLNATPSILVNGTRMENPFDYNELSAAIESELSGSGS